MEITVNVPNDYEIDEENSTFDCIKFKKKESRFAEYDGTKDITGCYISNNDASILDVGCESKNTKDNKDVFTCQGAAISALAFAQISQIREREYDRYGIKPGIGDTGVYAIYYDVNHEIQINSRHTACSRLETYLAFDAKSRAYLFLKENEQLIKDYFMMS